MVAEKGGNDSQGIKLEIRFKDMCIENIERKYIFLNSIQKSRAQMQH